VSLPREEALFAAERQGEPVSHVRAYELEAHRLDREPGRLDRVVRAVERITTGSRHEQA
jgi:hypothetical protein